MYRNIILHNTLENRIFVLIGVTLAAAVVVFAFPAIPQDLKYHAFADTRTFIYITNFCDFLSNLGFLIAGVFGFARLRKYSNSLALLRWQFFFVAIALVSFGSAYYHWQPNNETLLWDRLPMTLGFTTLMSCIIGERLGENAGRKSFFPLIIIGAGSVLYWWVTEKIGVGDLRPYILVQFLPMLLIPLIIILFPKEQNSDRKYWLLFLGYAAAKMFEAQDATIYELTNYIVSGHTLKHIIAAMAIGAFNPLFSEKIILKKYIVGKYDETNQKA